MATLSVRISLLQNTPRTAKVRTTKPSKFIVINPSSVSLLQQEAPSVLETLHKIARSRLKARTYDPLETVSPLRRFAMEGSSLIRHAPMDVRELIANDHLTVILGEAGAGKTTVLRRVTLDTANQTETCAHLLRQANNSARLHQTQRPQAG